MYKTWQNIQYFCEKITFSLNVFSIKCVYTYYYSNIISNSSCKVRINHN